MKFYVPPTIKSDFEDWLNTDVANVNYDFEIIRDWYAQATVKRIRATYFPIAWKSKIGNSDANSNFKTGYGWEIRKGDIAVREDGTIYMLNWQVQRNPNNQSTQAIACNARLSFARHMDEALELGDYLPQSFANTREQAYLDFLWSAFQTNYAAERYEFASLAFHLLYMSFVSFSV